MLRQAAGPSHVVACLDTTTPGGRALRDAVAKSKGFDLPPNYAKLKELRFVTVAVNLDRSLSVTATVGLPDGKSAGELQKTLRADLSRARDALAPFAEKKTGERGRMERMAQHVIRELKKDQLVGDAILPKYEETLKSIEDIIRREHLVTLPVRPARISLATRFRATR